MHLVDRHGELESNVLVVLLCVDPILVLADVVPIETVLEGEGVGDLKLLPGHDSRSAYLVRLDAKAAVLVVEHVRLLGKYPG